MNFLQISTSSLTSSTAQSQQAASAASNASNSHNHMNHSSITSSSQTDHAESTSPTADTKQYKYELFFFGGSRHHFERYKPFFNNVRIRKVKAGASHQLILTEDYELYIMGKGYGIGHFDAAMDQVVNITHKICSEGERIVEIATKGWHNLLVTNTGKVISFGQNDYGQCGHEDVTNPVKVPTVIKALAQMDTDIKFVATGTCHSIAASSHHVYTFGSGKYGRLGHGSLDTQIAPMRVEFFEKLFNDDASRRNYLRVEQVSCACNNSLVLDSSGTVYIMGKYRGDDQTTPVKLSINTRVRFISGGDFFTGLITSTDELYTFGDDSYGQLGNNARTYVKEPTRVSTLNDVHKICCGSNHMAALTHDGRVYTWGKGEQGRLGFDSKLNVYTPKELTIVRKKDIRQLDATSDYILLCNSECSDGYSNGGALGTYQRRNFEQLLASEGTVLPFSDVCISFTLE